MVYKSELKDDARQGFSSKTNLHPHMFQFDTQASDGPIIGFSYEMSLRPFTILKDEHPGKGMPVPMNTTIEADAVVAYPQVHHATAPLRLGGIKRTVCRREQRPGNAGVTREGGGSRAGAQIVLFPSPVHRGDHLEGRTRTHG